jgi:hypothetical protein
MKEIIYAKQFAILLVQAFQTFDLHVSPTS